MAWSCLPQICKQGVQVGSYESNLLNVDFTILQKHPALHCLSCILWLRNPKICRLGGAAVSQQSEGRHDPRNVTGQPARRLRTHLLCLTCSPGSCCAPRLHPSFCLMLTPGMLCFEQLCPKWEGCNIDISHIENAQILKLCIRAV